MTTLKFPDASESWDEAFNNGLARGEFVNDPASLKFWGFHELLASETEDEKVIADWFVHKTTIQYVRISREDKS